MIYNNFLQIGTVIKIKENSSKFMIVGYCPKIKTKELFGYDYLCCIYPIGFVGFEQLIAVKNEEIEKIEHIGYNSEKTKQVNIILENINKIIQEVENARK